MRVVVAQGFPVHMTSDSTVVGTGRGRGGRGRGGGGRGGRGGGGRGRGRGRGQDPSIALSKNLSQLLRHGALQAGLGDCLTPEGFVPLRRVLALPRFKGVTHEVVQALVADDVKGRFELRVVDTPDGHEPGGAEKKPSTPASDGTHGHGHQTTTMTYMIRACQGHTLQGGLDDEAMLTRVTGEEDGDDAVTEAVHGTSMAAWATMREQGLSRMRRRHVHLAMGLPGVRVSSSRPRSRGLGLCSRCCFHLIRRFVSYYHYPYYQYYPNYPYTVRALTVSLPIFYCIQSTS